MKLAYWKKYDRALKRFTPFGVHRMILSFAQKLGNPYKVTTKGRKPKLMPIEYAAYIVYKIITTNATFREMEFESTMYTGIHLDHSTLVVNFEKIPPEYFLNLIEETGAYLDRLLEFSDQYVIDSTAITTPLTFETVIKGKMVEERIEFRSHIIASMHQADNTVCIRKALATTKNIADCEGAKMMLDDKKISNVTLHADRGYDYERVYQACYENNIQPNIKPQSYDIKANMPCRSQGILEYNDKERKKHRGIIETVFGGLTNAGLLVTRLKKEIKIISFGVIVLLRHNIMNIARNTYY
jgi:hypothetical protein